MGSMGMAYRPETVRKIVAEVLRIANARRDFIIDRSAMRFDSVRTENVTENGVDTTDRLTLKLGGLNPANDPGILNLRRGSLSQVANTLKVPVKFLDRLEDAGHTDMISGLLNDLLEREPGRHLLRTLDGRLDALLSTAYRTLDNSALLPLALRLFKEVGAEVWDLRHTPDHFSIMAVAPGLTARVRTDRPEGGASSMWTSLWGDGGKADVVNAALTLKNSPTGRGGLVGLQSILRGACKNTLTMHDLVRQVHIGKKNDVIGEIIASDETKKAEDKLVWCKIGDAIRNTFDPVAFQKTVDIMNGATQVVVEAKPAEAVDAGIKACGLPKEHAEAILEEFLGTGDKTQYGFTQAFTALVNPENGTDLDDETRNAFEAAGGKLMAMSAPAFSRMVKSGGAA